MAAIALPQYTRAVEKSRLTEALSNIKAMENSIDIYLMENGYPSSHVKFKEMGAAAELTGGEWDEEDSYITKNFRYDGWCFAGGCGTENYRIGDLYALTSNKSATASVWNHRCYTDSNDLGRYICKSLESLGWEYLEGDL